MKFSFSVLALLSLAMVFGQEDSSDLALNDTIKKLYPVTGALSKNRRNNKFCHKMKIYIPLILLLFLLISCNQQADKTKILQTRIDSLKNKLSETYKPGFGEFMGNIQIHHAKLWFAGKNQNWKLADFEVKEIKENLEGIQKYCSDRTESKSIGMINDVMDSLSNSITQKNKEMFQKNYYNLTNSCNTCHQVTNFGYNVVIIPKYPPFSNQDFQIKK